MTTLKQNRGSGASPRISILAISALLAAFVVAIGTIIFLSKTLPEKPAETFYFPATGFSFAFGSGSPSGDLLLVNEFANGYALLSSGPVDIDAEEHRALSYTWLPPELPSQVGFFWRRAEDSQNIVRTDITAPGTQMIDMSAEPGWQGQITEFGFLVAGKNGETTGIGETVLVPDSLNTRLKLSWNAWIDFEEWSQQSINFLYGGDYRQIAPLPLLVASWLLLSLIFLRLFLRFGNNFNAQQFLAISGILFLVAWLLLDVRWTTNNLRQIQLSLSDLWQADEQQQISNELDGEILNYVQRLKSTVLGKTNTRILIIGDDSAVDYYLLRAKYHLLPHSANVAGQLAPELSPDSLDFVIFFGQPTGISDIPGWDRNWRDSLVRIDSGELGAVYRVQQLPPR